ncbi:MAG: Lon protease-like protein [Hyphomicrobiaceae bacterium]|jgi:Lon protease-like protein
MNALPPTLRLFPLGEVVHFPDTLLPLHIFEPRYQQLLADSVASDGLIGMVLLRRASEDSQPAVYEVGCAGNVREHKSLEDGRSVVVLEGAVRFRIQRELQCDELYRKAEVQALYEAPPEPEQSRVWAADLRKRIDGLVKVFGGDHASVDQLFDRIDEVDLVNALSAALPLAMVEKQSLLECPTVQNRYARLVELLDFKEAEGRSGMSASVSGVEN